MIIQMKQQQVEHALIETAWKHNWDPGREGPTRPIIGEDSEVPAIQLCPPPPCSPPVFKKPAPAPPCDPRHGSFRDSSVDTDTEAIPQLTDDPSLQLDTIFEIGSLLNGSQAIDLSSEAVELLDCC